MSNDLRTLQYPRHLHAPGGVWKIVNDAEDAAAAIAAGWALSPDGPFVTAEAVEASEDVPQEPYESDPAVPPVAARKKPGRKPKPKE